MASQIINKQFWSNYSRLYDKFYPKFQNDLLKYISKFAHGKVADFGTGTGKLYKHLDLNTEITSITGYDSNEQMLNLAKKKFKIYFKNIQKNIQNIQINELEKKSIKEKFDTIFIINVLYANENPIKILIELDKLLNKHGTLVIVDMKREVDLAKLFNQIKLEYKNDEDVQTYYENNQLLSKDSIPRTFSLEELESITHSIDNFKTIKKRDDFFLENVNCLILEKQ